jgi:RNA polymerase sigma-70 factor (ECF subfamily)
VNSGARPARENAQAAAANEAALIRAARDGDHEAFESLVRAYDRGVLRLALRLLRSSDDAYDVYQETFLRAFKNLGTFRFDCTFGTWLYRIVTNVGLDHLRKRRTRREEPNVVDSEDGPRSRLDLVAEDRELGDPLRTLANRQLCARIEAVLAELTARERMVFELRHYQGMRLRAIGEALGTTEEAAKTCLFRATQKMRAALGDFV